MANMIKKIGQFFFSNKSTKQTLMKNNFWLFSGEFITKVLKYFLFFKAAKVLGVTLFGSFNFGLNLVTMLSIFTDFGVNEIMTREFSADSGLEKKILPSALSLKILLNILTFIIIFSLSFLLTHDLLIRKMIWIMGFYIISDQVGGTFMALYRYRQKMEIEGFFRISRAALTVAAGLLCLHFFPSLLNYSFSYFLGSGVVGLLVIVIYYFKEYRFTINFDYKNWLILLGQSWPLAFSAIFARIYHYIDSLMLGSMGLLEETGYYTAAYKIIDILVIPTEIIGATFFPLLSKFSRGKENRPRLKETFHSYFAIMAGLTIPILVSVLAYRQDLILAMLGEDYLPSEKSLIVLLWGVVCVSYITVSMTRLLTAAGYQRNLFYITVVAAVLNIILNIIMIPRWKSVGAAYATLITYIVVLISRFVYTIKYLRLGPFSLSSFMTVFFSGIASFGMYYVSKHFVPDTWHVFLKLGINILVFFPPFIVLFYSFRTLRRKISGAER